MHDALLVLSAMITTAYGPRRSVSTVFSSAGLSGLARPPGGVGASLSRCAQAYSAAAARPPWSAAVGVAVQPANAFVGLVPRSTSVAASAAATTPEATAPTATGEPRRYARGR